MDILDTEASEDESTRKDYPINRPPSHEANIELTSKGERYRHLLDQARESDETVRRKWYEWEDHIQQLTLDEVREVLLAPLRTKMSYVAHTYGNLSLWALHTGHIRVPYPINNGIER